MKHFISIMLILCLTAALMTVAAYAGNDTTMAGLANPLHETNAAELVEKTGFSMEAPEKAENIQYFYIDSADDNDLIAEMRFCLDGTDYCYRMKGSAQEEDISGMYYTWENETEAKIAYNTAKLCWNDDKEGVITWYDIVPGVMYSLAVTDKANPADLCSCASSLFQPLQGNAYGEDEQPVKGPVYGCVTYSTNNEFAMQILNSKEIYRFAIDNEKTKIYCFSFATGDYLQVTYTGELDASAVALEIQNLQIITDDDDYEK